MGGIARSVRIALHAHAAMPVVRPPQGWRGGRLSPVAARRLGPRLTQLGAHQVAIVEHARPLRMRLLVPLQEPAEVPISTRLANMHLLPPQP